MKKILVILILYLGGCVSINTNNPYEKELLLMANDGDLESIHSLCYGYIYGRNGLNKDYSKSFMWCQRSAILGYPSSQTLFAEMYYSGKGIPVDYKESLKWYSLAGEQNHKHALLMMYYQYHNGHGVKKDEDTAQIYLNKSACLGYEKAINLLSEEQLNCAESI